MANLAVRRRRPARPLVCRPAGEIVERLDGDPPGVRYSIIYIPQASKIINVKHDKTVSSIVIVADTVKYRRENDNRALKKTLSIPGWLSAQGEKAGVNFSQILQDGLKRCLKLESPVRKQP